VKTLAQTAQLAGVPEQFDSPADRARFIRPAHRAGVELYRAHIVHHAFKPHCHDAFGLGAIESGIERFRYRGADHLAGPGSLVLMDDDELHTGRAETDVGWRYRMVYIDRAVLEQVTGHRAIRFANATVDDPARGARVTRALDALWGAVHEPLAFDGLLHSFAQTMVPAQEQAAATARKPAWLNAVRDYVDAHLAKPLHTEALAQVAQLSPFHFLRSFKQHMRFTPHAYVQAQRVHRAKRLLAAGNTPADAAQAVGLVDQAHLTRLMKSMFGVTPGAYQQQSGTRRRAAR
jgi:AraC-like DNA-binding protein